MSIIKTPAGHYVLSDDTNLSKWVTEQGRLNVAEEQIAFYAHHIPLGGTVLDAGACIGDHTATLARLVGPTGTVIALEPNPESFEALRMNFADKPWVHVDNIGLGSVSCLAKMHRQQNVGASFVSDHGDVDVQLVTIDSLCLDQLDFLHLDCEGFEIGALTGGRGTLARCRPVIVLEVSHEALRRAGGSTDGLMALLDVLGYDWAEIEPHHGPHLTQRDIIALPRK